MPHPASSGHRLSAVAAWLQIMAKPGLKFMDACTENIGSHTHRVRPLLAGGEGGSGWPHRLHSAGAREKSQARLSNSSFQGSRAGDMEATSIVKARES